MEVEEKCEIEVKSGRLKKTSYWWDEREGCSVLLEVVVGRGGGGSVMGEGRVKGAVGLGRRRQVDAPDAPQEMNFATCGHES